MPVTPSHKSYKNNRKIILQSIKNQLFMKVNESYSKTLRWWAGPTAWGRAASYNKDGLLLTLLFSTLFEHFYATRLSSHSNKHFVLRLSASHPTLMNSHTLMNASRATQGSLSCRGTLYHRLRAARDWTTNLLICWWSALYSHPECLRRQSRSLWLYGSVRAQDSGFSIETCLTENNDSNVFELFNILFVAQISS